MKSIVVNWHRVTPSDFEYDFVNDKLSVHGITFQEAVECFYSDFEVRRNKRYTDRYQLIGRTVGGRQLKIIFQLKADDIVRIITDWPISAKDEEMKAKPKDRPTEAEIDEVVVAESDQEDAWEPPIFVHKAQPTSITLPGDLLVRAQFLANVHREPTLADWLARSIQERIELEEIAFQEVKQEFATKTTA